MSNDDLRWSPPDGTHPLPSGESGEETAGQTGFAPLPELAPLPNLAPLPDIEEFLRFAPPMPGDEAVAGQADTGASEAGAPGADVAPHPGVDPLPNIEELLRFAPSGDEPELTQVTDASPTAPGPAVQAPASSLAVHTGEHEPIAHEPAPEPHEDSGESVTPAKQRLRLILIACVCVVAIVIGTSFFRSSSQQAGEPVREPGYRGTALNTHSLSPEWASGIAIAWTIPIDPEMSIFAPHVHAEGSTLYLVFSDRPTTARSKSVTVMAYDVSGTEPRLLWNTNSETSVDPYETYTPQFVWDDDLLFFRDLVIDKATGTITQAPWGKAYPLGVSEGIVVTCLTYGYCTGWSQESGEWTQVWKAATVKQSIFGLGHMDYTAPDSALIGSGEQASILIVPGYREVPQLLNVRTGELTNLGDPDDDTISYDLVQASDGVIVAPWLKTKYAYDSAGGIRGTFNQNRYVTQPTRDGGAPTLSQLSDFFTKDKTASWTTGVVEMTGNDCATLELTLTSDASTRTVSVPDNIRPYVSSSCFFLVNDVRASADGSVMFIRDFPLAPKGSYFFDTATNKNFNSAELDAAQSRTWVFDDMLIGASKTGVTAFVPASS